MLELLLELFGELLLQVIGEVLVELGLHARAEQRRAPDPWLAVLGYLLAGAALGGLSLLVLPNYLVPPSGRMANGLLTPVAVGGVMMLMGAWRARRGQAVFRIDRFACGYLFAFSLASVRFAFAA